MQLHSCTIIYQRTSNKLDGVVEEDWDGLFNSWYERGGCNSENVGLGGLDNSIEVIKIEQLLIAALFLFYISPFKSI